MVGTTVNLEEQAAAKYGLGVENAQDWKALAPNTIPSLESLLDGSYDSDNDEEDTTRADDCLADPRRKTRWMIRDCLGVTICHMPRAV